MSLRIAVVSTACALVVALCGILLQTQARADIPLITYTQQFSSPGAMPVINNTGQSSCAFVFAANGGSATVTPFGSADGVTFEPVDAIGVQSSDGTYGGGIVPYLSSFYVAVDVVAGVVTVTETCSAAAAIPAAATATPSPVPTFSPTPTPSPVPTPPTPTPSPTPANCPIAIASLSPLAYYKLDEAPTAPPAAVADSSGNGYDGTVKNNGGVFPGQPPLATPAPGGDLSYQFMRPGYVALPTTLPYGPTFSIVSITSPVALGTYPSPICLVVYHRYCVGYRGGYLGWSNNASLGSAITTTLAMNNNPHFIALVEDNSGAHASALLSLDGGTLTQANTANLAPSAPFLYSYLMDYYSPTGVNPVYQDDVAIFSYKLTQGQVTALATTCGAPYTAPTPSPTPTPIPPGNYQAAVMAQNPLAYYRLDEPSGTTTTDISGNGYNGTINSPGSTTLGATSLLASDADAAYTFTANTAHVTLPALPNYNLFTAVFLVHGASYAATQNVLNWNRRAVGVRNNHPSFNYNGVVLDDTGDTLVNGTTYWLAVENGTGSDTGCSWSVNGSTLRFIKGCGGLYASAQPSFINANYNAAAGLVGTVDEVAIFPRLLTQAQLTALAATAGYSP